MILLHADSCKCQGYGNTVTMRPSSCVGCVPVLPSWHFLLAATGMQLGLPCRKQHKAVVYNLPIATSIPLILSSLDPPSSVTFLVF